MLPPSGTRIFGGNSSTLRAVKKRFVVCMHNRLTQFFQLRIPKTIPFLFLWNANLKPDFQKCIAFGVWCTYIFI